jgi:tetratricopeptide (TPR) repeat protein
MRAFTCYTNQGMLEKAKNALNMATALGDETAQKQIPWIDEMIKYEDFAVKALEKKAYREAFSYLRKLMDSCVDSVKHTCLYLEALVSNDPNDMTDPISFSTKIQTKFITAPEFLFWRGRILIYNGQQDMGRKHIKQALTMDPDSVKY